MARNLTSAGRATAYRFRVEQAARRVTNREMRRFLRSVVSATAGMPPGSIGFGLIQTLWNQAVPRLTEQVGNELLTRLGGRAISRPGLTRYVEDVHTRFLTDPRPVEKLYQVLNDPDLMSVSGARGRPAADLLDVAANRVARAAATQATGFATLDELATAGFRRKRWVSLFDGRTRGTHLAASGQTVDVVSPFMVGGWPLMVPGDPAGPTDEIAGCRCSIIGVG